MGRELIISCTCANRNAICDVNCKFCKKGKFIFKDLPIDEEVKVVVIDEKDGKPLLRIIDTQTSGTTFKIEKVEPVTLVELQEKLKELD